MKDRELMARALLVIEGSTRIDPLLVANELRSRIRKIRAEEHFYSLSKEQRDQLRLAAKGNRNLWKEELTAGYEKAKELRACGLMLKDACAKAGITPDQWYRRQSIEKYGKSRTVGRRVAV